jgi:hypothetical protein
VAETNAIQRFLQDSDLCLMLRNFLSHPRLVVHELADYVVTSVTDPE